MVFNAKQYFSYIVVVSRKTPPTCRKSLTNYHITYRLSGIQIHNVSDKRGKICKKMFKIRKSNLLSVTV